MNVDEFTSRMMSNLDGEKDAEIERLRKALEPFALNIGAVSLSKALGHISREHLLAARDALIPVGKVNAE